MFGYVNASNEPLPPAPPPLSVPETESVEHPAKPWNRRDTMSVFYFFSCLAAIILCVCTGHDANIPPMPDVGEDER